MFAIRARAVLWFGLPMWESVLKSLRCAAAFKWVFVKAPPNPPSSSVCHSQFVASIFNGLGDVRKAPASISVWTNKIVQNGYCFPITVAFIWTQIRCENVWDIVQLYNKCCQIETPVPMISRFTELLKHSKLGEKNHASKQITLFFLVPEKLNREP